uniref:Uncharacterized protein n=3 Tax=Caenorhabditis japonica TaxID=281687 RepID=A0A8R1I1Z9_CAEJA
MPDTITVAGWKRVHMYLPQPQKQCDCHVNDPSPWTGEVHGLSQALMSKTLKMRIFWWIVILICIGCGSFFTVLIVIEYTEGPTATSTTIRLVNSLEFPAITICPKTPDSFNIAGIRGDIKESLPHISDTETDDLLEFYLYPNEWNRMRFTARLIELIQNKGICTDHIFGRDAECMVRKWYLSNIIIPYNCTLPYLKSIPKLPPTNGVCKPDVIADNYLDKIQYVWNSAEVNEEYEYVKEVYTTSIPGFMSQIGDPRSTMTFDNSTNIYPPEKNISKEHIATLSRRVITTTPPSPVSTIIDSVSLPPHFGLRQFRENPLLTADNQKH